jgi:exonuclease III
MKFVSWNCRGLGNSSWVQALRDLIRKENSTILLIQETKLGENEVLNLAVKFWRNNTGLVQSSHGASGGLGTFWDNAHFFLQNSCKKKHIVVTGLEHRASGLLFNIINVYGLVLYGEKK